MENKDVFQDIIADYAAARPGYPDELFRDIVAFSGLTPQADVLEIGAGPGQASEFFADRDYAITALEISDRQVAYLKNKFSRAKSFRCVCAPFEEYVCEDASFDLIFSATAFHWIQPEVGYPKAFRLLKENGVVAVFWHMASIVEPKSELQRQIRAVYRRHAPQLDDYLTETEAEELHQRRFAEIRTRDIFHPPVSKVYRWQDEYTAERCLQLMNSYSDFHSIDHAKRAVILKETAALIELAGGVIQIPQEVRLYMAKKNSNRF